MSSFLCFVCHSTVNADTNEDTRDKYREVIGMNLCPDSHLCFICCYFLNKMWLFKSICLKRSLEYPVLFSEKGTINLQRSDTQVVILCPEDLCLQHLNSKYHFYNNETVTPDFEDNYVQLHEEMHFGLLPNNVEVQTDDIFHHFNVNLLKADVNYVNFSNEEFLVGITKDNEANTRKDIDEFIFGNDSVESPLDNINKIELTNLDEMSEVNITLTDLNVRNFEKLHKYNVKNDIPDKTYLANSPAGNPDCMRNSSYVDKSDIRNDYEKPHYIDNRYVDKSVDNEFVDKQDNATPQLVRNIDYIVNPQEITTNNGFVDKSPDNDYFDNNCVNSHDSNYNDHRDTDKTESETEEPTKNIEKPKKNVYNRITLTLEEQKMDLESSRRDKKYIEAVYKCHSCAIGFLFKDTYQAHMMRHEESNGEYRCSVCTLRFANRAVLRSHRANHATRYQCSNCEQMVRSRHRLTHSCGGERSNCVPCDLCGRTFKGSNHYQQHLRRAHHLNSGRTYPCNVCGKRFSTQAAVRTHMITHINKKFDCDVCPSTFSSPYTLNQHKKKHNSLQTELHYCTTCNIGYNTRKSLLAHQRNALAHKERVYKCPVCDKTCPTLRSLHNHTTAVHARSKDFFCAMCPARYATRKGLVRHMKAHNNSGPRQQPLCHACGQSFKSSSILKRHIRNVCEKDKMDEELSKYYEQ